MKKNNKKGFTLVELVIVVAVMAVLVAVAIPAVGNITGSAKASVAQSNAQTIESMIKLKEADLSDTDAALSADAVAKALVDGKLGITSGTFIYTTATGKCEVATSATDAPSTAGYKIEFTAGTNGGKDTVTVTPYTAAASGTGVTAGTGNDVITKNLDGTT